MSEQKRVTLVLTAQQYKKLRLYCVENDVSLSQLLYTLAEQHIAKREQQQQRKQQQQQKKEGE